MIEKEITAKNYVCLMDRIAEILITARSKAGREINKVQVLAYWEIGRGVIEFEQKGKIRAEYGKKVLVKLSEDLTKKFGRGFSTDNLELMRKFYLTYLDKFKISETVSRKSQKSEIVSIGSAIRQTASYEFEPMLS